MEIKSISKNFFKTSTSRIENNSTNNSNHTNPFGVNFKGNIITADVFVRANSGLVEKVSNKSKMLTSAIVGSLNAFNQSMSTRLNSIVSYGKRLGTEVSQVLNREISMPNINNIKAAVVDKISSMQHYSFANLGKMGVNDLENELSNILAVRG